VKQAFVDVDVEGSGDEGVRKGEANSSVQPFSLLPDRLADEGKSAYERFGLAALETSGHSVDRVEDYVCEPTKEG
jgi:hypothetical protein